MTEMTNRSSSRMDIKAGLRPWSNIQKGKGRDHRQADEERQAARGRTEEKRRVK